MASEINFRQILRVGDGTSLVNLLNNHLFYYCMEKDLKFAILKSSKKVPSKIENWIFKAYDKNVKIFGRAPSKKFKILICNSEEEWKEESKYYYFPFGA